MLFRSESARLGIEHGQFDTGWLVLRLLEKWRLAGNLGVPRGDSRRDDLLERTGAAAQQRQPVSSLAVEISDSGSSSTK